MRDLLITCLCPPPFKKYGIGRGTVGRACQETRRQMAPSTGIASPYGESVLMPPIRLAVTLRKKTADKRAAIFVKVRLPSPTSADYWTFWIIGENRREEH